MRRIGSTGRLVLATIMASLLVPPGGGAPVAAAEAAPDRSEVVLVLDFSASILEDATNRRRFAAALDRIADRVDERSADLVAGDTTVSIVQFAARARNTPGCTELELLDDPAAVATFADCLRDVADAYSGGLDPELRTAIGIDTNYVAAMERAATHLPADAVRPTLILFTDGRHDVAGVPVSEVQPAHERLFGDRSPFALLPVGMGLDPADRDTLTAGLEDLRIIRDMPPCVSGTTFDWPEVTFESADDAGNAVAVALQSATCTFTVPPTAEPDPSPTPTPIPTPTPGEAVVRDIQLTPGDGRIDVTWTAPADSAEPPTDYRTRCSSDGTSWIESTEGVSLDPRATVEGLTAGAEYECQVAVVTASSDDTWTSAGSPAIPLGTPAAPAKPTVAALNGGLEVSVARPDDANLVGYRYECSRDGGTTWDVSVEVASPELTTQRIGDLTNGTEYVCRVFALSAIGPSDASPVSDIVRPCGSMFDCNPLALPILGGIMGLLALGVLVALFLLYRERTQGYVLAVLDVVHTANLGRGSTLGIELTRAEGSRQVTGIVSDRGPNADFRIRALGNGRFAVTDKSRRRQEVTSGESVIVVDSVGMRHELILRAFDTKAASAVARRR